MLKMDQIKLSLCRPCFHYLYYPRILRGTVSCKSLIPHSSVEYLVPLTHFWILELTNRTQFWKILMGLVPCRAILRLSCRLPYGLNFRKRSYAAYRIRVCNIARSSLRSSEKAIPSHSINALQVEFLHRLPRYPFRQARKRSLVDRTAPWWMVSSDFLEGTLESD